MKKELDHSHLRLGILGLISIQPMSGYDLRKVFLTTAMKSFSASPGAIYPALRQLEKDGLIEGRMEKKETLRPRRAFTLTPRGRSMLSESLTRPITRQDIIRRMDTLLLRFSFMGEFIGEDGMADFLQELAAGTESYLGELEAEFRKSAPALPFSGRAALGLGVEIFRVKARWAKNTLAELKKRNHKKGDARCQKKHS